MRCIKSVDEIELIQNCDAAGMHCPRFTASVGESDTLEAGHVPGGPPGRGAGLGGLLARRLAGLPRVPPMPVLGLGLITPMSAFIYIYIYKWLSGFRLEIPPSRLGMTGLGEKKSLTDFFPEKVGKPRPPLLSGGPPAQGWGQPYRPPEPEAPAEGDGRGAPCALGNAP